MKLITQSFDLDIWRVGNATVDVRVPFALWNAVLSALPGNWDVSTMIPDVQELVEQTRPRPSLLAEPDEPGDPKHPPWDMNDILTPFHDEYHSFDDMLLFGNALVQAFPPDRRRVKTICRGTSLLCSLAKMLVKGSARRQRCTCCTPSPSTPAMIPRANGRSFFAAIHSQLCP